MIASIHVLVKVDALLYLDAVRRFEAELREAERITGVQVLCEQALSNVRQAAEQLVRDTGGVGDFAETTTTTTTSITTIGAFVLESVNASSTTADEVAAPDKS